MENGGFDIGGNLIILIPLILIILFNIFFRRRRGERTPVEIVDSLYADVVANQQIIESFNVQWRPKKFKMGSWNRNKARLNFLAQELQTNLTHAFEIAESFNQDMDAAKKYKSSSYLSGISVEKLRGPLDRCRQGIEEWTRENKDQVATAQRRRGLFS